MKHRKSVLAFAFAMVPLAAGSLRADPILYSSAGPNTSLVPINGRPNPSSNGQQEVGGEGAGDDFNTGYQFVNITGMSFYGGDTDPNQVSAGAAITQYRVTISFYSQAGQLLTYFTPSTSELYGSNQWRTLSAADFNNFPTIYGAGYVVFQPSYVANNNPISGYTPPPTGTPQFTLGYGSVPSVGANDPTTSAFTVNGGGLVPGGYVTGAGPTAQYAQFQLTGTAASSPSNSPLWTNAGSGNWTDSSAWTLGVPNSTDSTANFFEGISADSTVALSTGETVGTLNFDNPLHRYTLAGSGTLTLSATSGAATLNGWGGGHTILCPVTYTAGLNVTAFPDPSTTAFSLTLPLAVNATGTLTKSGMGTLAFLPSTAGNTTLSLPALTIWAGTVALESSGTTSNRTLLQTSALTINGGRLDIGANDADLVGANASGYTTALTAVRQGFANGAWNGSSGITSSAASVNTSHLTAIGVILNSVTGTAGGAALYGSAAPMGAFDGQNPSANDVLVKYTYYGDANLDGKVDGSDYSRIDSAFVANQSTPGSAAGWYNGDFNYDGVVNGSDYTLIDNAFNTQGARLTSVIATTTAQIAPAISAVPEPTSIALTLASSLALFGRRRRHVVAV